MHNFWKPLIAGLFIFLVLLFSPFLYQMVKGIEKTPAPTVVPNETECVKSVEYMRANHMDLLVEWRDEVVRDGKRRFHADNGRIFQKSLTNTCLKCHGQEEGFCEKCHDYTGVNEINCWKCHNK